MAGDKGFADASATELITFVWIQINGRAGSQGVRRAGVLDAICSHVPGNGDQIVIASIASGGVSIRITQRRPILKNRTCADRRPAPKIIIVPVVYRKINSW